MCLNIIEYMPSTMAYWNKMLGNRASVCMRSFYKTFLV